MGDETRTEVAADLPSDLAVWLDERAAAADTDRGEVLARLVAASRAAGQEGTGTVPSAEEVATLREAVTDLEAELEEQLEDVRERVIQVKREADAKAPADHDHAALADEVAQLRERVDELAAEEAAADTEETEADLIATVETLERRVDEGFENYEAVVEDLLDRADETAARMDTLARVVRELRSATRELQGAIEARERGDAVKREANRKGISEAACEACDTELEVALLAEAACPACGEAFTGVRRRSNFWKAHTLEVGEAPALAAGGDERVDIGEAVFDEVDGSDPR